MKITVAVDGSSYTTKALEYLVKHRANLVEGNELQIVNVVTGIPPHVTRHIGKEVLQGYYDEEAEKVLGPVKAFLADKGIGNFTAATRHGHASEEIVRAAKEGGCDLIVMGTRGHGFLGRTLLGSVATKVLAESEVSVLLVQ